MAQLSIIIPVYCEEDILRDSYNHLVNILEKDFDSFEVILIDDGSSDKTLAIAEELAEEDNRINVIALSRNYGKDIALTAGLDAAKGDYVVPLDVDMQDPPELICEMIEKLEEGYDVVYGVRTMRHGETKFKKLTAWGFYKVLSYLSPLKIPENTGDFRVMRAEVVDALRLVREHNRFMKGIFAWVGFRQVAFHYQRAPRCNGTSKWNYLKLWDFAIDGITSFSGTPLRFASVTGLIFAVVSLTLSAFYAIKTLIFGDEVQGFPTLAVLVTMLGSIQLICLGIMGEYLVRLYNESKERPLYITKKKIGTSKKN